MDDTEMLQTQNRHLERENRSMRRKLRDDFAMAALTGYLSSWAPHEEPCEFSNSIAEDCYKLADAMLEARQK